MNVRQALCLGWAWLLSGLACSEPHYVIGDDRSGAAEGGQPEGGQPEGGEPGAPACPAVCANGCLDGACDIEPRADGTVAECPAGLDCIVHCEGMSTCLGSIHCGDARSCQVKCEGPDNCRGDIVCDRTASCVVECSGTRSCSRVDCAEASACHVSCTGTDSCSTGVQCAAGACEVDCQGSGSCAGASSCAAACACDFRCLPGSVCADEPPVCPAGCASDNGCSSAPQNCASCG